MYHSKDLVGLYEAYSNVSRHEYLDNKRILLEQELNSLYIVNENFFADTYEAGQKLGGSVVNMGKKLINQGGEAAQGAYNAAVGAVSSGAEAAQNITTFPSKMQAYFNEALPQFIDKLGEYLKVVLISGASGAVLTQVIGRLLLMFSKKLQKAGQDNEEIIMSMLPDEIAERVAAIKDLKQTNPKEYTRQVFKIRQNALKELRSTLNGTTKRVGSAVMQKILTFFGEVLSSVPGSLLGGVVIAYLIQKLGFNPMPIFPSFN